MPSRKVAKDDVISFLIKEILQERTVSSQRELASIINEKLRKSDSKYSVSAKRVRRIAVETNAKINAVTKRGSIPKRCPSCNRPLKKMFMKNLLGKKFLFSIRCQKCGFAGKNGKFAPLRYEFTYGNNVNKTDMQ